jgi:hypothetical protein
LASSTGSAHARVFETLKHNALINDVRGTAKGHLCNSGNADWGAEAPKLPVPWMNKHQLGELMEMWRRRRTRRDDVDYRPPWAIDSKEKMS